MEIMTSETIFNLIPLVEEYFEKEVEAEDFFCRHKMRDFRNMNEEEADCFIQIAKYEEYLIALLKVLYDTKKFIKDDEKYINLVILYIICFKLPHMSESNLSELAFTTYPSNWKIILEFFGKSKNLSKIGGEGCKILDTRFCHDNILVPLQRKSLWMKQLSHALRKKLYNLEEKNLTVPKWPFSLSPEKGIITKDPVKDSLNIKEENKSEGLLIEKPKKIKCPKRKGNKQEIHQEMKVGTQGVKPKICGIEEDHKASTRKKTVQNFKSCEMTETSPKMPPTKTAKKATVALNTTALLRQSATIQQNEWKQIRRLNELCNGGNDPETLCIMEAEKKIEELWQEKRAIEAKRLRALLWQEEATIAREGVKQRNRVKAEQVKAERDEIEEKKLQLKEKQEMTIKKLVEKSQMIKVNAQNSVQRSRQNKSKKAKKLLKEKKLMKEAAQNKREEELLRKAEIVQEIQRLHKRASQRLKKNIDLTETSQLGLSCEMSIAELRERLRLTKLHIQAEIEDRKLWIKGQQQERKKLLKQTEEYIMAHKESRCKPFPHKIQLQMKEEETPEIAELKRKLQKTREERKRITGETKAKQSI